MIEPSRKARVFKPSWFAKAVRKAHIRDRELCETVKQVMKGQADDPGSGVFKKRLNKNMHRSIILAKGGQHWIYEYLFAKRTGTTSTTTNWTRSGTSPKATAR